MNLNPSAEEAVEFISKNQFLCEDIGIWTPDRNLPMVHNVSCGLLTLSGERTPMTIELFVKESPKTKEKHYKFTLLRREVIGYSRYYQLDVRITRKPIKDLHALSHEHFGKGRIDGTAKWNSWQYEDVLGHFCQQTNIQFKPVPINPDIVELRRY